jgi:colanic acid/amylovoran biosynthesis glycosyltransferase
MKIAYLTSFYARASDTFIRNEVVELRARGHTVHTFSIRRASDPHLSQEVLAEQATTDYILSHGAGVLLVAILQQTLGHPVATIKACKLAWKTRSPGTTSTLRQLAYLTEAAYLAGRLRRLGVQLLHNHIAENSATVAMLASEMSGVPFSMTVHGPGIFYHPLNWALPEKIRRSAFTACISHFCRSQCMLFTSPEDWSKLRIVRCAVGRGFETRSLTPIPAAPRLVCVGRLYAEKGLLVLVEAVAQYVQRGGQCEVVLIGDGPLRASIERMIADRGLQRSIVLRGWQSSAAVADELRRSRAMVVASFAEGLPVVVMEALAMGRPVVSTAIAGIPELVEPGKSGWLVPAGSVDDLAAAIGEVARAESARLEEMGRYGAGQVALLHNLDREVDTLEALFRDVVERSSATMPLQSVSSRPVTLDHPKAQRG